jgi:hypothetical protein
VKDIDFTAGNARHLSLIAAVMQIAHEIFLVSVLGMTVYFF